MNIGSQNTCTLHGHRHRHRCLHHHHRHHYHLFYLSPHCPFHRSILVPNHHLPSCSFSNSLYIPQNPTLVPLYASSGAPDSRNNEAHGNNLMMQDGFEKLEEEEDEEEEEEPVFVMTDEWRDFFAQSEAKRRLAKKQAKKKHKC